MVFLLPQKSHLNTQPRENSMVASGVLRAMIFVMRPRYSSSG